MRRSAQSTDGAHAWCRPLPPLPVSAQPGAPPNAAKRPVYLAAPTRSGIFCRSICLVPTLRQSTLYSRWRSRRVAPFATALANYLTRGASQTQHVPCPLDRTPSATALHVYPSAKRERVYPSAKRSQREAVFSLTAPLPSAHPGAPPERSNAPFTRLFPTCCGALTPLALK